MSFIASGVFVAQKPGLLFLPLVAKENCEDMISEERTSKHTGGGPKKAVKREIIKGVRFTKVEYFVIKQKASKAGIGITIYIREMALEGQVIARLNEEERQFVRQLVGMANNLNQLTKKAHQEGLLTAMMMFEKYRKQLMNS